MAEPGGSDFSAAGFKSALSSTQGKVAIVTGLGVVGWYWYRQRKSAATNATATASGTVASTTTGGDTSSLGGVDTPSGSGGYSWDGGAASTSTVSGNGPTNATWAQNAIAYLSNLGQDPGTVASALGAYLSGQPLTTAQQGIVTTALGTQGQPPTQVPISSGMTGTNPSGGTTTVTPGGGGTGSPVKANPTHTVTVSKGETQKEIINAAGVSYADFTKLNPSLAAKGSKVHTGQKVIV